MSSSATSRARSRPAARSKCGAGSIELLRVPDAALLRGLAEEGRLHDRSTSPTTTPSTTAPSGAAQTVAALAEAGPRDDRPAGRDRVPAGRRRQGRARRLRPLSVGAVADEHPGRTPARREGGSQRRRRRRDDARRCGGLRQDARAAGHGDVPRREPRQRDRVLARRRRGRAPTSSSAAARTSCAGWSGTTAA